MAASARFQRGPRVPTIRVRSRSRRSGSRPRRLGVAPQPVADALDDAADPGERAVEGDQHGPDREQRDEHDEADQRGLDRSRLHAAAQDRGHGEHRHGEHHGEDEQAGGREPGDRAVGRQPGLDEHPVLQRGADRAAAGRDLRQRVAGELRATRRRATTARACARYWSAHRQASDERLQAGHRRQPARGQLVEVVPGAEHLDQARRDEVERHAGDREPEHGAAQPRRRGPAASPRSISCSTSARCVDRALDAVADWVIGRRASVRSDGPGRRATCRQPSPLIPSPISFAPMTRHSTAMIAALWAPIHALSSSSRLGRAVAQREVDRHRRGRPERADEDEHGERDRLLAGVEPGLGDRRGGAHGEQQVLRVDAGERHRDAERAPGRELSIVRIHFGSGASAPARGRPRHCLTATRSSSTPSTSLSQPTQVAGSPPSSRPRRRRRPGRWRRRPPGRGSSRARTPGR